MIAAGRTNFPPRNWTKSDLAYRRGVGRVIRYGNRFRAALAPHIQAKRVNALARILREALPNLDFAVCGLERKGRLARWIKDLRSPPRRRRKTKPGANAPAAAICSLACWASHMMLPGGHAGGVIDLLPGHHLKNVFHRPARDHGR